MARPNAGRDDAHPSAKLLVCPDRVSRTSSPDIEDLTHVAPPESEAVRRDLEQTVLSGLALTVPSFVTVLVLVWAVGTVAVEEGMEAIISTGMAIDSSAFETGDGAVTNG